MKPVEYLLIGAGGYLLIIFFAVLVFKKPETPDRVAVHCDYARDPKSIGCSLKCDREKTCLDLFLVLSMLELQANRTQTIDPESVPEEDTKL